MAATGYSPHWSALVREPNGEINYTNPVFEKIEWLQSPTISEHKNQAMMNALMEGGSRYYGYIPGMEIAGKTGTAQNPHGENHGWFIAFAPADDPQIAIAVLMENSGFGSVSATPIASLIIEKYLTGEIKQCSIFMTTC
jgi:penicillin-binding protein 2